MDSSEVWLETDYEEEGLRSLEFTVEQLTRVIEDSYRWKWVIIALHNSLQAFMVKACSGTDLLGAMDPKYRAHWLEHHATRTPPTQAPKLLGFGRHFKQIQHLMGYVDTRSFEPTEGQERAVRILNSWRNELVHYKPGSMSFDVSGLPDVVSHCLGIVRFLAFESMNVFRGIDERATRTQAALDEAAAALVAIRRIYGLST